MMKGFISFIHMFLHTPAFSLIRSDYKERASRYVLLTREHGKIEARMEGARNIHSKLSPQSEPVSLIDAYLVKGKAGYKLIQVSSVKRFSFSTPEQWSFVIHFIETLDRLLSLETQESVVYEFAGEVFSAIESTGPLTKKISDRERYLYSGITRGLMGYVYLRLLSVLGYFPGNLLESSALRQRAEEFLSMGFRDGIVGMEKENEVTSLVMNTVKEILQTKNKSSGFLKEVLRDVNL